MDKLPEFFLDYAESEFEGDCFNGPSLMATLESLKPATAASNATYEGYSAWEVANHVAYYKYFLARSLGAAAAIEPFPFDTANYGFSQPEVAAAADWAALLAYLKKAHRCVMEAIAAAGPEKLAATMPEWKIPFGKAAAWLCSHDSYHLAQIRNMGIEELKSPKESSS
jgi:hypothetical protein